MNNKVYRTLNYDNQRETYCIIQYYTKKTEVYLDGVAMPLGYKNLKEVEIMLKLSEKYTEEFNEGPLNKFYN